MTAIAGYDRPGREVGVQYRPGAKVARAKMIRSCGKCCCASHCLLDSHGSDDVGISVPGHDVPKLYEFADLLDRSWFQFEEYAEEMYDSSVLEQDKFMSLLCAVNTDLGEHSSEEDFSLG